MMMMMMTCRRRSTVLATASFPKKRIEFGFARIESKKCTVSLSLVGPPLERASRTIAVLFNSFFETLRFVYYISISLREFFQFRN